MSRVERALAESGRAAKAAHQDHLKARGRLHGAIAGAWLMGKTAVQIGQESGVSMGVVYVTIRRLQADASQV